MVSPGLGVNGLAVRDALGAGWRFAAFALPSVGSSLVLTPSLNCASAWMPVRVSAFTTSGSITTPDRIC